MKRIGITLAMLLAVAQVGGVRDFNSLFAWLHPVAVEAGHPACDPNQPKRSPCDMNSCAQMAKKGSKCSSYCAKTCCRCAASCVPDYPGEGPNPDEGEPQ